MGNVKTSASWKIVFCELLEFLLTMRIRSRVKDTGQNKLTVDKGADLLAK
jgi:hypothetical protein